MILPQVHLRRPCYDFFSLLRRSTFFAARSRGEEQIAAGGSCPLASSAGPRRAPGLPENEPRCKASPDGTGSRDPASQEARRR
eukprot:9474233-Pyramimonas_sp.AAC.1